MNDITDAAVRTLVTELVGKALRDRFGIELKEPDVTPRSFGAVPDRGEATGHPEDPGPVTGMDRAGRASQAASATDLALEVNRLRRELGEERSARSGINAALERATPDELLAALLTHPDISETDPTHELARAVIRALYDAL